MGAVPRCTAFLPNRPLITTSLKKFFCSSIGSFISTHLPPLTALATPQHVLIPSSSLMFPPFAFVAVFVLLLYDLLCLLLLLLEYWLIFLAWPCSGNHNSGEFRSTVAMSCPRLSISQSSSLSAPFPVLWDLWGPFKGTHSTVTYSQRCD